MSGGFLQQVRRLAAAFAAVLGVLLVVVGCTPGLRARAYSAAMADNGPFEPFEMAPGLYYVGTSDIAVFALRTSDGIVLIDGGYETTAPRVLENMRAVGLAPRDVRFLLNTHAHVDHAGGLAALKRATGAALLASPKDATLLEDGGRNDFFLGSLMTYPRVEVDRRLTDGEQVTLGDLTLTAHFTPGHTKGCTSWSFPIVIDGVERQALIICSLSTLRFRLVDNPKYPRIVEDYEATYATLRRLPCEVFLGPHGRFFDLHRKRAALGSGANPFVDPTGCKAFIDDAEVKFRAELARQRGG